MSLSMKLILNILCFHDIILLSNQVPFCGGTVIMHVENSWNRISVFCFQNKFVTLERHVRIKLKMAVSAKICCNNTYYMKQLPQLSTLCFYIFNRLQNASIFVMRTCLPLYPLLVT